MTWRGPATWPGDGAGSNGGAGPNGCTGPIVGIGPDADAGPIGSGPATGEQRRGLRRLQRRHDGSDDHRPLVSAPLRLKLVAALLALVMIALFAIGAVSALVLRQHLQDRVDDKLREIAQQIATGQLNVLSDLSSKPLTASDYVFGVANDQVTLEASRATDKFPAVPSPAQLRTQIGAPFTVRSITGPERWRILVVGNGSSGRSMLIIGCSLASVDDAVDQLVATELIIGVGVLAVLASVGVAIVQASLRPLTQIEVTAAAIAAGDLTQRVPGAGPDTEVGRLASALNTMLTQIEGAFDARAASEERMRQFVADASHELRTPLTTIRGFAELYRQGAARAPEQTEELLKRIEDEAARMGLLVEDLLLLARLDRERPLNLAPVELAVLARDAVVAARVVAPGRTISLELPEDPVLVIGDESRLRQVVGNLMTNALTHTPSDAAVTVRVLRQQANAVIEVSDAGPGLTAEQQQRVFERFYRVDKARTRQAAGTATAVAPHSGTGLGLAIVAALVSAHGGSVSVSSAPGRGATFAVSLPAMAVADSTPVAEAVGQPGKPERRPSRAERRQSAEDQRRQATDAQRAAETSDSAQPPEHPDDQG